MKLKAETTYKDLLDVDQVEAVRNVNGLTRSFLEVINTLQQEVGREFINEFGINGPIDLNSLSKMARITSKYAASDSFPKLRRFPNAMQKQLLVWQTFRNESANYSKKLKKQLSVIPARLSFFYFYNGELCKGVLCLLDYVELVPEDIAAAEMALRWLIFLGETELASKKLESWKLEKSSELVCEVTRLAIGYYKSKELRKEYMEKLIAIRDKIKSENVRSFARYELASYVSWICSTLSNVPVSSNLEGCEFPDRLSQLQEAYAKADSILRNRIPGLSAYAFDNSTDSSIWGFLIDKKQDNSTEYVYLGSTMAWYCELRREISLVHLSTAQGRDAMSAMILNLRMALKSVSLFRILQAVNNMSYYTMNIEEPGSEENMKLMRASCVNLLAAEPIIVHCSTPVKVGTPARANTPLPHRKNSTSQMATTAQSMTMVEEITDRFGDLDLLNEQSFHPITRSCGCNICTQYPLSSTFAAEYMFAFAMYSNFSQASMQHFNEEFGCIRTRDMKFQTIMHGDKSVRPRPNIIQNEVFGHCVIQWLIRKIESKEPADPESLEIFKNAMKIVNYLQCRTVDLYLAVTQLGRQFQFPFEQNHSWMRNVPKKPLLKAGIGCAVDILRAVSPFGRRSKTPDPSTGEVDKKSLETTRLQIRSDMNRYAHILYRDWRCRMYPYMGRISENPWEAAYAFAESTAIGSRNAVQWKLEKCRKGLVTISGPERFKRCVEMVPEDMTLVQIAMADNKQIYLIKMHADREPIIMPLANYSQVTEMMDKFSFLLDEDEKIAKCPDGLTAEEFWKKRKIIDGRLMTFVDEVQKNFLGVAASLLMPSKRLGPAAKQLAEKIVRLAKGALRIGEARELVHLANFMDSVKWEKLCLRFCEMRSADAKFTELLPQIYAHCLEALKKDKSADDDGQKKYTYLVVCPHLSQFCWERLPIFENFPYIGRQVSIHSFFGQLESLQMQEKEIPLQINVQNAYYVLDPENNLGETKRRMLDYINKFQWEGTVGAAPNTSEITTALAQCDAFFYIGHGSGSTVMPRAVIKQSTCNAISLLMGCGSVRTIPQALGFDGKSALVEYAIAKCPLIVGCLWTVTDGEIDRYMMRMVDDCFEQNGADQLRHLSEAMHEARSKAKLKYLTGAAVVMYGLPVVSKPVEKIEKIEKENVPRTPKRIEQSPARTAVTPRQVLKTPAKREVVAKTPKRQAELPKTPRATRSAVKPSIAPTFAAEDTLNTTRTMRTRSSARTPSRAWQN